MKFTTIVAFSLVLIGAIVWGLVGIFNINLVTLIFGSGAGITASRVIYTLVGLSGLWLIVYWIGYRPFSSLS